MMKNTVWVLGCALLLVAGCEEYQGASGPDGQHIQVSDSLREMAAPYQDLNHVRIDENDGCYVYRHVGPVETTYLPLRTKEGRPICTKAS